MKNILAILFVVSFWSAGFCQDLIQPIIPTPQPTVAQLAAESVRVGILNQEKQAIEVHKILWETTWENPRGVTPQEFFDACGAQGRTVLECGGESVAYIARIAALKNKAVTDLIAWKYTTTPFNVTVNPDGSVTVHMDQPNLPPVEE